MARKKKSKYFSPSCPAVDTLDRLSGQRTMSYVELLELSEGLKRLFKIIDMAIGGSDESVENTNWNQDFGLACTITIKDARVFKKLAKKVKAMLE